MLNEFRTALQLAVLHMNDVIKCLRTFRKINISCVFKPHAQCYNQTIIPHPEPVSNLAQPTFQSNGN